MDIVDNIHVSLIQKISPLKSDLCHEEIDSVILHSM